MNNDGSNDGKTSAAPLDDDREGPAFSKHLLTLYQQMQAARCREEREKAMMEFAAAYAAEHDHTDASASDVYHDYIESYERAQLAFKQNGMRLARMAAECVTRYLQENEMSLEDVATSVEKSLN